MRYGSLIGPMSLLSPVVTHGWRKEPQGHPNFMLSEVGNAKDYPGSGSTGRQRSSYSSPAGGVRIHSLLLQRGIDFNNENIDFSLYIYVDIFG